EGAEGGLGEAVFEDKAMFSLKMLPLLLLLHVQLSRAFPVSSASPEEKNRNIVQNYLEKFYQLPRIVNYTPNLTRTDIEALIEEAFKVWSDVSPLTFNRTLDKEADIQISFAQKDHGDNSPFDGPNGILAHAFQPGPGIGGDVHFDAEETWTKTRENDNFWVIRGYAVLPDYPKSIYTLGFPRRVKKIDAAVCDRSTRKTYFFVGIWCWRYDEVTQTMDKGYPRRVVKYFPGIGLRVDAAFQHKGPSSNPVQPTGPTTPTACDPRLTFDAVTTLRGEILFFKDKYVWRKHRRLRMIEFNFISLYWPSLPNGIQAAYEDFDRDLIFVFKGTQYWALSGYDVQQGYPKHISNYGFPSSVQAIDAAVSYRRKTYFFVNDQFWRWFLMSILFHKMIDVAMAFEIFIKLRRLHNAFFLFFSGPKYHAFDFHARRVTRINRSNIWLDCRYS
ncbi:hypothetical protein Celaphus_00008838, partial [Cervus elaphus hippelaphus]